VSVSIPTVVENAIRESCVDVRGTDFETLLVGPVTELVGDADRYVRRPVELGGLGFNNGFPNWEMYRTAYCGDAHMRLRLRDWCVAYAIAYCEAGGVRKGQPADEIGCLAGWDAFYALLNHKWVIAGMDVADVAGVDPKTYRKVRNHVYGHLLASLKEYWDLMQIAVRHVARINRKLDATPQVRWSEGRGFGGETDLIGDGCFVAKPRGSGC
jgi:hypothetical protein